jgi:hypothetical protein
VSAEQALVALAEFFEASPDLELVTVARPGNSNGSPEARVLSLGEDADAYFRGVIDAAVIDGIEADWVLKRMDPLYKPDPGDLEWIEQAAVDAVGLAVDRFSNLSPLAPFDDGDEGYKRKLVYYVAVLTGEDGRKAFFFRSFSASAELKRKRGAALVARNGTFHVVDERIFLFDESIDAFVFDGYLYVIRKRDYRRIFDQLDVIRRNAQQAAQELHAKVPIANFAEFEEACSTDSRMADKMLAVRERDYFDQLSYAMVSPVIDEFGLDIPTTTTNGEVQLVFKTSPGERFRILKLVDDDYLASSMTNHRYEVNSKGDPP